MEPSEVKPERGSEGPDETGHAWQVLAEYVLQLEMGEDELARQGAAVTEAAVLGLELPTARLELLKNAVSQAALNARGQSLAGATGPASVADTQQTGLPMKVRILTPGGVHLSNPGKALMPLRETDDRSFQAWGYFLVEKMVRTGVQVQPVIELFLYPEGSI